MRSHMWKTIYWTIVRMNRAIPRRGRKCQFTDTLIVAMFLWSVMHDRPMCWAADKENYFGPFRPRRLPSRSQFCRRLATARCEALRMAVERELTPPTDGSGVSMLDGRALTVGPYTQDREAGQGHAGGGFAWGYKLHALSDLRGTVGAWRVTPLNVCEKRVAFELIEEKRPRGWVLADGNYDSGVLYDHALARGAMLLTPLPRNAGGGHRRQSPVRLLAARLWKHGAGRLYRHRTSIERQFSRQSCYGGGLGPLPAWVRGLTRVRRWVGAKLMLYHVRMSLQEDAA